MDVKRYTIEQTLKELVLLESHLRDHASGKHVSMCLDCETKHLLMLEGLAQEGVGFFLGDDIWPKIGDWAGGIRNTLRRMEAPQLLEAAENARQMRKALVEKLEPEAHHGFQGSHHGQPEESERHRFAGHRVA